MSNDYFNDLCKDSNLIDNEQVLVNIPSEATSVNNSFPDFLFPKKILKKVKRLVLTKEEQEFLGLLTFYEPETKVIGRSKEKECGGYDEYKTKYNLDIIEYNKYSHLPYEYVEKKGTFNIMALDKSLSKKIKHFRKFIIKYIMKNPDKIFDVNNLARKDYKKLCKHIQYEMYDDEWEEYILCSLYDFLKSTVKLLQVIKEDEGSTPVAVSTYTYEQVWNTIEDKEVFLSDLYADYITIIEKEWDDEKYLQKNGGAVLDKDNPDYRATKYATMTEKGQKLLEWFENN